jgi:vacuolar-type H+-ATPase subunit H
VETVVRAMKGIRDGLVCGVLLFAMAFLAVATVFVARACKVVEGLPGHVEAARASILAEVAAVRHDAGAQITAAERDAAALVDAARKDVAARADGQLGELRVGVLAEAAEIRKAADRRLADTLQRADAALGKVEEIRGDLRPALVNAAALTKDAQDSIDDLYFDVKASVGSATVAASSFAQMSEQLKLQMPRAQKTFDGIGGNVEGITANIDRLTKPHWYDRLLGYGLNGIVMYRNLNPVTNLTVKGVQAVSGRP